MNSLFRARLMTRQDLKRLILYSCNVASQEEACEILEAALKGLPFTYWTDEHTRYISVTCYAQEQPNISDALTAALQGWKVSIWWRSPRREVRSALLELSTAKGWSLVRPDGTRCRAVRSAIEKNLESRDLR